MSSIFTISKGTKEKLTQVDIEAGALRFTTDTYELYVDMDDSNRVRISNVIMLKNDFELAKIVDPVLTKLYFVEDGNILYHYDKNKSEWQPIGKGLYGEIDEHGAVAKSNSLATSRKFIFSGDAIGENLFDGTSDCTITLELANSGVSAGSYGEAQDKTYYNHESIRLPYISVDQKGRVTEIRDVNITLDAIADLNNYVKKTDFSTIDDVKLVGKSKFKEGYPAILTKDGWKLVTNEEIDENRKDGLVGICHKQEYYPFKDQLIIKGLVTIDSPHPLGMDIGQDIYLQFTPGTKYRDTYKYFTYNNIEKGYYYLKIGIYMGNNQVYLDGNFKIKRYLWFDKM